MCNELLLGRKEAEIRAVFAECHLHRPRSYGVDAGQIYYAPVV